MAGTKTLRLLRAKAHWRVRRGRVQKEIAKKKSLQAKVGERAKRDLGRYIAIKEKELEWLQKIERSSD